jgi:hypothetical protein
MGLTLHYSFTTPLRKPQEVRRLVQTMREVALDLPFQEVSEVKEFSGPDTAHQGADDPDRWLKIQSCAIIQDGDVYYQVPPRHIIAFSTQPGDGCEPANFGFCKYPGFFSVPDAAGGQRRLATHLTGWRRRSFCKTQYASDPRYGGIAHFLRCHLCLIQMLDLLKASDLVSVEVKDEGGYWEHRDVQKLAQEVGSWNEQLAGLVSQLRSASPGGGHVIQAPITGFANFEHLEAKGLQKLADLRRALGQDEDAE